MKIIVIGGTGLIGKAVVERLKSTHQVLSVGFDDGDYHVNIEDIQSIRSLFKEVGKLDAIIMTTGNVVFKPLNEMTENDFMIGLKSKVMGQINTAIEGIPYLNDNGVITLTSGILNEDPIYQGTGAAVVNGAIDGFVKAASIDLPRGIRINAVSPTVILEAMPSYEPYFRGFEAVPVQKVANTFLKSTEGKLTGHVFHVI
jgi:NAD(P)-dependent dehydrogenase (short-subunit alcohol dehydrogenase family)